MSAASLLKRKTGSGMVKWQLHTHFEVDRSVPIRIDVTRRAGGEADERAASRRCAAPIVIDRLKPVLLFGQQSPCRTGLSLSYGFTASMTW
ncbi:MAG: hypothetical protein WCJ18_10855 [Planctomycetota bacterium]